LLRQGERKCRGENAQAARPRVDKDAVDRLAIRGLARHANRDARERPVEVVVVRTGIDDDGLNVLGAATTTTAARSAIGSGDILSDDERKDQKRSIHADSVTEWTSR